MMIYNTTYHVDKETEEPFLSWLRERLVPAALQSGELAEPRLCRVETEDDESEGRSYSLQFAVADREVLNRWYVKEGARTTEEMVARFGDRVAGFVTLLRVMDI